MNELTPEQVVVGRAGEALHRDGGSPAGAFELLEAILRDDKWRRIEYKGSPFASFRTFVTAPSNYGLATTPEELRKIINLRHPQESSASWRERAQWVRTEVERLLDEAIEPVSPNGANQHGGLRGTKPLPFSDTGDRVVARLKRDDPELADRVISGEVSKNAAAKQKGWRKPRIVLTSPRSVASRIRQHFTTDQIAELILLLQEPT
jgi:hypothetical protein